MGDYAALSDAALLARLIGTRASKRLYKGTLRPFFSSEDSGDVPEKCKVAKELVRRSLHEELRSGVSLTSPGAVRDYLSLVLAGRPYEVFMCLWLDTQHRMLRADETFRGTLSQTSIYPREIVKTALEVNAAAVIFAHNHPSGIAQPSHADETLTRNLKDALSLVDVRVLDHFVVAGNEAASFAERGLL